MIALIVAFAKNQVIGNKGCIPWKIKGEQKRFRELTTGNVVIMGRRSYEEIGRPLPNRTTIVVSRTKNYDAENCMTAGSLAEAIEMAGDRQVYISGGARIYEEALPVVEKMYITEIDLEVEGDTFFPAFDKEQFVKTVDEEFDGEIPYKYVTYTRKQDDERMQ
ncbi:MAG: dihydrofolate reductase [Lachnospiraceae bacterium]|nr:dihydrofolate reductase [Lachnospiraceae bacterium]